MKKFLSKVQGRLSDDKPQQQNSTNEPSCIRPPTSDDIFRYRYHHGTNLGSVFVLEKWLSGSMFPASAKGDSELDAVSASVKEIGVDKTREKWEEHWSGVMSGGDWEWLTKEAKCTSIRLPVGWWVCGDGEELKGSEWEGVAGVYRGAWKFVRQFVAKAHHHGVGVLIDLHGLPGGANADAHSGTSSGKVAFWGNKHNVLLATKALHFMATEIRNGMNGVIGLQIVNESVFDAKGMYDYYDQAIRVIGDVDQSIPMYISDGWDLERALNWSTAKKLGRGRNPVVIDTHRYYTFSDKDRSQSPQQIISRIPGELSELDGKEGSLSDRGEAQVIVGEWSCVLDGQTWSKVQPQEKEPLVRQFGQSESRKWSQKSGGSFFWTYKMDWMPGGEWGFVEQIQKGNIFIPTYLTLPSSSVQSLLQTAQQQRGELSAQARKSHEDYWNSTSPGKQFQHHLYSEGWDVGFSDASVFFGGRGGGKCGVSREGADRIGCLEVWVMKRLGESGERGEFRWEWEQGFRAGIKGFEGIVGI